MNIPMIDYQHTTVGTSTDDRVLGENAHGLLTLSENVNDIQLYG